MKIGAIVGVILGIIIFLIMIPYISMEECTPETFEDTYTIVGIAGDDHFPLLDTVEFTRFIQYHTRNGANAFEMENVTGDPGYIMTGVDVIYLGADFQYNILTEIGGVCIQWYINSSTFTIDPGDTGFFMVGTIEIRAIYY